jgi:hypothetical protein
MQSIFYLFIILYMKMLLNTPLIHTKMYFRKVISKDTLFLYKYIIQ